MGNKTVTVTVSTTTSGSKRTISISVDPEPVQLDDTVALDTEGIEWEIDKGSTPTYWTFTTDNQGNSTGIEIKNHRGRFKDPGGHANPKKHNWIRKLRDNATYNYTISVTNETAEPDPTKWARVTWDPSIQNN